MTNQLVDILQELKTDFGALALKAEFEAEGAAYDEIKILKELADNVGLDFVLKIGGCEAIRDLKDAASLNITKIVAPMIESHYAFQKFINSALKFSENSDLYINIETYPGFLALDDILADELSKHLAGVVFGRSDFAASKKIHDLNSFEMLSIVNKAALKLKKSNKEFILGGGICADTLDFIKNIQYLTHIETRKILFANEKLEDRTIEKALDFEIKWIKYKQIFSPCPADKARLLVLQRRISKV